MNPILHDLQNKQLIWTAANNSSQLQKSRLSTGYDELDKVLAGGFPSAGMIHLQSPLGCGEMRFMLSVLQQQPSASKEHKLFLFIDPPFELNAEFLLSQKVKLEQLIVVRTSGQQDALWSAEQSAKSGACEAVFMWQHQLNHSQVKKLEHAALQGGSYCIWLQSSVNGTNHFSTQQTNLPLTLSISLSRQQDTVGITINKQKVGWAQKVVKVPMPFTCLTNSSLKHRLNRANLNRANKVVPIRANK